MRISTKLLSLYAVLALSACSESSNVGPDFEPGMAVVPVMVSAAPGLSTLVVEITATDITTPLAYNLTMVDGTASDTITIPAGSDRTITVRGYDSNNIETHRGSTVTNLVEGSNTAVTVTLDPLAGDQPVVVVMGGVTVEISPAVDTVAVGSTIQLTGVVLNDQGDTLEVTPVWSTLNPAVATVDSTGLVTGVSAGSATVVGTYGGVGASAAVEVSALVNLGLIAFQRGTSVNYNDASTDIWTVTVDGVTTAQLTLNDSSDTRPMFSPDGTKILFGSDRGKTLVTEAVWVMAADGSNATRLTENAGFSLGPSWSRDGSKIAFYTTGESLSYSETPFWIASMNADGSGLTSLNTPVGYSQNNPEWSLDGSKIFHHNYEQGQAEIYVMDADGTNRVRLTNATGDDWLGSGALSPDGTTLVFTSQRDGDIEIYTMATDGSNAVRLTSRAGLDQMPSWSPDGSQIVFSSDRGGTAHLFVMDADGSNVTQLTFGPEYNYYPSWR